MKKLMILTTILMALGISTACADNDKPIAVTQLPQKAQLFIKTHFPKEKVAWQNSNGIFWKPVMKLFSPMVPKSNF